MAKFNITVDIDYIDEDGNLDDALCDQIVNSVVSRVSDTVTKKIEDKATEIFENQISNVEASVSDRLNAMMDEFFSTPKDITDQWGDVIKKGVTVKQTLKEACDNFLTQPVDQNGSPTKGYGTRYNTRVDYIVAKSIDYSMDSAIKRAVSEVTDNLKKKISDEIKTQMGEKLANFVGLDKML